MSERMGERRAAQASRRAAHIAERPFERPVRSERAAREALPGHTARQLVLGVSGISAVVALAWFARFLGVLPYYPSTSLPWLPWIAFAVVVVGASLGLAVGGGRASRALLIATSLGAVAVVAIEIVTTAGLLQSGVTLTASAAVGMLVAPMAVIGDSRWSLITAGVLGLAALASAVAQAPTAGAETAVGLGVAVAVVFPAVLTSVAISGFRHMVGVELDLSLVQSAIDTDRAAVGMRASEELATLDFEAERLLDGVGSGRIGIPLSVADAADAAALAAGLRVRLIEGRTDTWLRHAVAESEFLATTVVVDDPDGAAAALPPSARDALLLTLWLLVDDRPRAATTPLRAKIAYGTSSPTAKIVEIRIDVPGGSRRRVDQATWEALGSVGSHSVAVGDGGIRVDIRTRVDASGAADAGPTPTALRETRGI